MPQNCVDWLYKIQILAMYCIIEIPEQGRAFLCERDAQGLLHVWDAQGKEIAVDRAPITPPSVARLVRRHDSRLSENGSDGAMTRSGIWKLTFASLILLAVVWHAQARSIAPSSVVPAASRAQSGQVIKPAIPPATQGR